MIQDNDINDIHWMQAALQCAQHAYQLNEVPIGAVVVLNNEIIGQGWNQPITSHDPSAHAEIVALRAAAQHLKNYRLTGTTMYCTIEPCLMCFGAMTHARIQRLVFGANEPKAGALQDHKTHLYPFLNHQMILTPNILKDECKSLIQSFFHTRRQQLKKTLK